MKNAHAIAQKKKEQLSKDFDWLCDLSEDKGIHIENTYKNNKQATIFVEHIDEVEKRLLRRNSAFISVLIGGRRVLEIGGLPGHRPLKPGGHLENQVVNGHRATGSFEPCRCHFPLSTCLRTKCIRQYFIHVFEKRKNGFNLNDKKHSLIKASNITNFYKILPTSFNIYCFYCVT